MAVISKGIALSYYDTQGENWMRLTNLQEIPDLGGTIETIEVTTLADEAHVYTDGLKNYGDSLDFKFLYEQSQFNELSKCVCGEANVIGTNNTLEWQVKLPDGTTCEFNGQFSIKLDGVGVNGALTYTLSIRPTTAMVWGQATT